MAHLINRTRMEGTMRSDPLSKVLLLGTIHGLHKNNNLYSYEDIFNIIDDFNPDVLGVEIRPEDVEQEREYLTKYYPYEMIEAKYRYYHRCQIIGFDWFEERLEGKLIPELYFEEVNQQIQLEQALQEDYSMAKEKEIISIIEDQEAKLVMKSNASEINSEKLDILMQLKQDITDLLLKETRYRLIPEAYAARNQQINTNIINLINNCRGKRILILMGAAHRWHTLQAINNNFTEGVELLPIISKQ